MQTDFVNYFEILLDSLVSEAGLCLGLSHHVVKVFLKELRILDQMHGHVVVCGTFPQPGEDGPDAIMSASSLNLKNIIFKTSG